MKIPREEDVAHSWGEMGWRKEVLLSEVLVPITLAASARARGRLSIRDFPVAEQLYGRAS
jgi:hypothetical protein